MKPLSADGIPKVLLLGNGIHRAFNAVDWDTLLKSMTDGRFTGEEWKYLGSRVPYPLLAVIASGDQIDTKMRLKAPELCAQQPAEGERQLLAELSGKGFDAILTTNYTYEIEYSLIDGFSCSPGKRCGFRYTTCKDKPEAESRVLYSYIDAKEASLPIWHIHGEAALPDTMVIGHYYYGKLLSRVQSYVAETVKHRNTALRSGGEFYPRSWVDYFLFGDVTIVGQGMDLSELDLWWLLNCKKRNGSGSVTYIEPYICMEKKLLAEAYGVKVISGQIEDYKEHYRKTIERI